MTYKMVLSQIGLGLRQVLLILVTLTLLFSVLGYSLHRLPLLDQNIDEMIHKVRVEGFLKPNVGVSYLNWSSVSVVKEGSLAPWVDQVQVAGHLSLDPRSILVDGDLIELPANLFDDSRFVGLNTLEAETSLTGPMAPEITWYEGYSAEIFTTDHLRSVLVPQGFADQLAEALRAASEEGSTSVSVEDWAKAPHFTLSLYSPYQGQAIVDQIMMPVELQIVGTYDNQTGPIYGSWQGLVNQYTETYETFFRWNDSLRFVIRDNTQIEALREAAKTYFSPDSQYETNDTDMIILDSDYQEQLRNLENTRSYLQKLVPILVASSLALSLVISSLLHLTRRRYLVLMRTLGSSNSRIILLDLLEALLYLTVSYGLAVLILVLAGIRINALSLVQTASLGVTYLIGNFISLWNVMRKNLLLEAKKQMDEE